jgi:hypothetical protein
VHEENFLEFIKTSKIDGIRIRDYINNEDSPDEIKSGAAINVDNTLYIIINFFKNEYLDIMNTVVHESTHATQEIFRIIGNDKLTEDLAESFAYLNGYISTQLFKGIFKKDKKTNKFYLKV